MLKNFVKLFSGDPTKKTVEQYRLLVEQVNALEAEFEALSDDALRAKTDEFKARISELTGNLEGLEDKEKYKAEQDALDQLMPEAFAAVREAGYVIVDGLAGVVEISIVIAVVQADDALAPLALEGWRWGAVFVGIPGENHQVDALLDRRLDDRIQRFKEVEYPNRQTAGRIVTAIIGHVDVRVGKVKKFHIRVSRPIPGVWPVRERSSG